MNTIIVDRSIISKDSIRMPHCVKIVFTNSLTNLQQLVKPSSSGLLIAIYTDLVLRTTWALALMTKIYLAD